MNERLDEFHARDCEVAGISVDSPLLAPGLEEDPGGRGGIEPVRFPLVSDLTKSISRAYGVLVEEGVSLRADLPHG